MRRDVKCPVEPDGDKWKVTFPGGTTASYGSEQQARDWAWAAEAAFTFDSGNDIEDHGQLDYLKDSLKRIAQHGGDRSVIGRKLDDLISEGTRHLGEDW